MKSFIYSLPILLLLLLGSSISFSRVSHPIMQSPATKREVAVTFDDLPGVILQPSGDDLALLSLQEMNRKILGTLVNHKVPAIGFVNEAGLFKNGQVDARIALLRDWLDKGMQLGNHTYAHLDFNKLSEAEFEDEVVRGEVITRRLLSERGVHNLYLRFPFNHDGNSAEKKTGLNNFLKLRGYKPAPFTIEHSDYLFNEVYVTARRNADEKLVQQIRAEYLNFIDTAFAYFERRSREVLGYEPKQIFLIHVNQINADCLAEMLDRIERRGYSFISFDNALLDKAYQIEDRYVGGAGISWIHRWSESLGQKINNREEPDPPNFILKLYQTK